MGRVKHKTTRKGSHEERARTHDAKMQENHRALWSWMRAAEFKQAMASEKVIELELGTEPYNVNHIMEA